MLGKTEVEEEGSERGSDGWMLVVREMQIKTRERYQSIPTRVAVIKKKGYNQGWCRCGGNRTLTHCWYERIMMQPLWKTVWQFLKRLNTQLNMIQQSQS